MPWLVFGSSTPSATGQFSVLTYNVAGLPLGLSGSNPEDFGFHEDLTAAIGHPPRYVKDTTDVQATLDLAL